MEHQDNNVSPPPPPLPGLDSLPGTSSGKRRAPFASAPRQDHRPKKRGKRSSNAVSVEALSASTTHVPAHTIASTSSHPQSLVASAASSVLSETGPPSCGVVVENSDVITEKEGGRADTNEENVAEADHAKTRPSSEMISTSGCGSFAEEAGSGSPIIAKQVVKRPVETGARSRPRRSSRISSSVNGGKSARTRSASNSASARADVLRASERGRRLVQIRTRKEAHARDKLANSARPKKNSENVERDEGSSSASELRRSGMTYPTNSTRPIEFKFASDLRIQTRKGDGQRMTRSTSSLSSGNGGANKASTRTHPVPGFKSIHAHPESSQAHRKENLHPVITQPFHWATEQRIKERKEFDEMVKEKERERELLEEQKRKEREEEEEMEIRELRKRAIPKANVVPDWYKDAPKKKKIEETIGHESW
ncbi:hypothetical protein AN958_11820 [Leucoagaricus sp. SymC.cos]|nr:hypothetical protein AN958_11820 [Leucoagaricus sp. SymC.cos]